MLKPSPLLRAVQWSSTLNLPRSTFPPRPLESARAAYLSRCTDELYRWQSQNRSTENQLVLHDGPPYANGSLHIGHALNKILKDIICRFHISQGQRVQYIPGWDCHGLPIEIKALKGEDAFRKLNPMEIRHRAKQLAEQTVELQKKGFKEWAVLGDWENAYQTMSKDFELRQLQVFKDMVKQGIIYRQFKPVHWSPSSGTALAEAELEYDENHISTAAYIKFRLTKPFTKFGLTSNATYALIWTTTPWTIPANRAIGINEGLRYCLFSFGENSESYLIALSRLSDVLQAAGINYSDITIKGEMYGREILQDDDARYIHPFRPDVEQGFFHGDFVTELSGTGLVHMAPGHGFDDYKLCNRHNIQPFAPVDDYGLFTPDACRQRPELLAGKSVFNEGTQAVLASLSNTNLLGDSRIQDENLLWATHPYTHSYPIDWRSKRPTIIRATAQWFADVEPIKESALRALENVRFLPESGRSRMQAFIAGRSQWCISRQRAWGVPIPALFASDGTAIMTSSTVEHIIQTITQRGIDAWWTDDPNDRAWVHPDLPPGNYTRGKDTMDVWFDSGTSWALLDPRTGQEHSDVYIEGTDQHRGWFQSSLLTHIAHQMVTAKRDQSPKAPFKTLITHGFTLDEAGRKMSKSIGNIISPDEITRGTLLPPLKSRKGAGKAEPRYDAMGPDVLRLWVASSDYTRDIVVGDTTLKAVQSSLHKYRVTFKWLLGALADYGEHSFASYSEYVSNYCRLADLIAFSQLQDTVNVVHGAYSRYEFVKCINTVNAYINANLSAFYFETAKDHLYTGNAHDRLRVQHVCFTILKGLMSMLGPILPLTVTEVIDHCSGTLKPLLAGRDRDPLLAFWGPSKLFFEGQARLPSPATQQSIFGIHSAVKAVQETARTAKNMRSGLECHLSLGVTEDHNGQLSSLLSEAASTGDLADIFIASSVTVGAGSAETASLEPWSYSQDVQLDYKDENPGGKHICGNVEVTVSPPIGDKCPRCWRWVMEPISTKSEFTEAPTPEERICSRCADVLNEAQESETLVNKASG